MSRPSLRLTTINLDAPDARVLADFYRRLLGWDLVADEGDWVKLLAPDGSIGLSCQTEPNYVPPTWPSQSGEQLMMMHLDIQVEDLAAAGTHAEACGATLAGHQPEDDVRVYIDPAGHPFCLWIAT